MLCPKNEPRHIAAAVRIKDTVQFSCLCMISPDSIQAPFPSARVEPADFPLSAKCAMTDESAAASK